MSLLPDDVVDLARKVIDANRAAGRTIAVAESCTGGLVSAALTEIAGSSAVFVAGYVTYSNEAKQGMLKVGRDVIETFGAVSVATALAMARGALDASGADVAVSITGIAGPDGGTAAKPVGYVCFNARLADGTAIARDPVIPGGREDIRERSALVGMHMLRTLLGGAEPPL